MTTIGGRTDFVLLRRIDGSVPGPEIRFCAMDRKLNARTPDFSGHGIRHIQNRGHQCPTPLQPPPLHPRLVRLRIKAKHPLRNLQNPDQRKVSTSSSFIVSRVWSCSLLGKRVQIVGIWFS